MNRQTSFPRRRLFKILLYITGILVVILVAGYFIANAIVRSKVNEALRELPPAWTMGYRTLQVNLLAGSLAIDGIEGHYTPDNTHTDTFSIDKMGVSGLHLLEFLKNHRLLIDRLRLTGLKVKGREARKEIFSMEGRVELDSVYRDTAGAQGAGGIRISHCPCRSGRARWIISGIRSGTFPIICCIRCWWG